MSEQRIEPVAATTPLPDSGPLRSPARHERPSFPLVLKLFLLTAGVILIVVGVAIGVTLQRASTIAHTTVNASIASAAKLFRQFENQRLGRLTLSAQLVGGDSNFVAYIQKNLGNGAPAQTAAQPSQAPDLVSIIDQLVQRKESFGSDLLILLDDQGRVVARTDDAAVATARNEDLYEQTPLVRQIVDDASVDHATGVLASRQRLYHAAVVPIATGANRVRIGYLVNAYAIDDAFASRIADATNAGVVFTAPPSSGSTILGRSPSAPAIHVDLLRGIDQLFRSGKPLPPTDIDIDRSGYVATAEPLVAQNQTVAAAVFIRSLDREMLPFRQIERSLLAAGGAALLLALFFSWLIAERMTRPIVQLTDMAQAITSGNYDVDPPVRGNDEVAILARSFAQMLTSLRDKAALEELVQTMGSGGRGRQGRAGDEQRSRRNAATVWLGRTPSPPTEGGGPVGDTLAAGTLFANRYRIEEIVGRGGMGVVYKAFDTQLDEVVAIKTLPGDVLRRSSEDLERFKREIRLARKITHRNVLRTYDYGESDGVYFISMELVRGYTLAECLANAPGNRMPLRVAVGTARQICRGLAAAHEQGIVHRDIKPQNVLIDQKGEAKLMDFGVARLTESAEAMTAAGLIIGTPHYMSPEQVQGKTLDGRADIYSMGVLLYQMLSGRLPFASPSLTAILAAHLTERPAPLEVEGEAAADLNAIVMRCLEKDPAARYGDAGALLRELDSLQMPQA